jgi:hypothetical protein
MVNGTGVRIISALNRRKRKQLDSRSRTATHRWQWLSIISVTTKNGSGNRGTFIVNVAADPACGSTQQLKVIVNN